MGVVNSGVPYVGQALQAHEGTATQLVPNAPPVPDIQIGPGQYVPGAQPSSTTVTRPSFLSAFIQALPASLGGAMAAPRGSGVAGGIAGGFSGIAQHEDELVKRNQQRVAELRAAAESQSRQTYQSALTQHTDLENQAAALELQNKKNEFDYLLGRNPAPPPPPFMSLAPGAQTDTTSYGFDAHVAALDKTLHLLPEEKSALYEARDTAIRTANPSIAHKALADVVAARGKPESASYVELRNQGLSPLQAQERLKTLTQHDPISSFGLWHQAFVSEMGREPNKVEVIAAQRELNPATATAGTSRSDKSFQFNQNELNTLSKPVGDTVARLGRLNDTIAQNSPQADALVAPELLTVMAGGQGSGLRMNEAEISRIVGGRSNWQGLQAAVNKWSLDPSTANSITPAQRKQIRDLTSVVNDRLLAKQKILSDAGQALIQTDNPREHRQIVADARSKLLGIDSGASGGLKLKRVSPNVVVEQ